MGFIQQFLTKECSPPPLLFFAMYIYGRLQLQIPNYEAVAFFSVGVAFALVFRYNHFYFYSPILNVGIGYLHIANLVLSILAINEKWKAFLFLFVVGDFLTMNYQQVSQLYLILSNAMMALITYRKLIFKTLYDNKIFFTGFSLIASYELIVALLPYLHWNPLIAYLWLPLGIATFYQIIRFRIKILIDSHIDEIKDPQIAHHYITHFQAEIDNPQSQYRILSQCYNCINKTAATRILMQPLEETTKEKYINNLYQMFLTRKNKLQWEYLFNKMIEFKIQQSRLSQALLLSSTIPQNSTNIFRRVQQIRNQKGIQELIEKSQTLSHDTSNYIEFFQYDSEYLHIANKAEQIIRKKQVFWVQTSQKQPKMQILQKQGLQIVNMMNQLHEFYQLKTKPKQRLYQMFNGTALYVFFLKFAMNFASKADQILKSIAKDLQTIRISSESLYETYGVQIKLSVTVHDIEVQNSVLSQYHSLRISGMTSSFAKALGIPKNKLRGTDINQVIPKVYLQKHIQGLQRLFQPIKDSGFKFIQKVREVPVQMEKGKLCQAKICAKILSTANNEIELITLIKKIGFQQQFILVDPRKQAKGEEVQILSDKQVDKTMKHLVEEWTMTKVFKRCQRIFQIKGKQMKFVFTSPFSYLFRDEKSPPIHINMMNDNVHDDKYELKAMQQLEVLNSIKNRQQLIGKNSGQIAAEEATTGGSQGDNRSNYIVILDAYVASNHLPFYTYFWLLFFLFKMACLGMNIGTYNMFNLPWNLVHHRYNPLQNINTIFSIETQVLSITSFFQDYEGLQINTITSDSFEKVYQVETMITGLKSQMQQKFISLRQKITDELSTTSFLFDGVFDQLFYNKQVRVNNIQHHTDSSFYRDIKPQNTSAKTVLTNFISDSYILSKDLNNYYETLIAYTFVEDIQPILRQAILQMTQILDNTLQEYKRSNVIMLVCFVIINVVMVYPIQCLYRKCYQKVEWIYELMVSVESEDIKAEIFILEDVRGVILKANNSAQIVRIDQFRKGSNTQSRADKYANNSLNLNSLQFNKRVAQLEPNDAQKGKAMIFLILGFIPFLLAISLLKMNLITNIAIKSTNLFTQEKKNLDQGLLLLNVKKQMDFGPLYKFNNQTVSEWIDQRLYLLQLQTSDQATISAFQHCLTNATYKICGQKFTQTVLTGLLQQYVRKAHLYSNSATISNPETQQKLGIRAGLLYAETIFALKYMRAKEKRKSANQDIFRDIEWFDSQMYKALIGVIIWVVICFLESNVAVRMTGLKYIEELKVLSFLSSRMVANNKRIQSFMNKLAREEY